MLRTGAVNLASDRRVFGSWRKKVLAGELEQGTHCTVTKHPSKDNSGVNRDRPSKV